MPPVIVTGKFPPPPIQTPFFIGQEVRGHERTDKNEQSGQISQAWLQWFQKIATTLSA